MKRKPFIIFKGLFSLLSRVKNTVHKNPKQKDENMVFGLFCCRNHGAGKWLDGSFYQ